jgi:hypothetical protein
MAALGRSPVASELQPPLPIRERAGDGNRTHVACLEGRYSTIELHPRPVRLHNPESSGATRGSSPMVTHPPDRAPIRSMPGAGDMGGAGFEPAKAVPPDLQSGPFGRLGIHPLGARFPSFPPVCRNPRPISPRGISWKPCRQIGSQSWRRDSNSQPSVYKTDALPIELRQQPGP